MSSICIGLFGTCGGASGVNHSLPHTNRWGLRTSIPKKDDWKPEDAEIEADHLVNDQVILFPVTDETYATGSLVETGFSILSALRSNDQRYVVIYIDPKLDPTLVTANPIAAKESMRARALVAAHLKKLNHYNVFIVDSLDKMLTISKELYSAANASIAQELVQKIRVWLRSNRT